MKRRPLVIAVFGAAGAAALVAAGLFTSGQIQAHKKPHSPVELKAFKDAFMEQVELGDRLFHGDPGAQQDLGVTLSETGMACAMCHPHASDTHPHEFPKYQEQMQEFATLRGMINWCIEKPNQGVKIDVDGPAMKALEAYIYWSNRGSPLEPGTH